MVHGALHAYCVTGLDSPLPGVVDANPVDSPLLLFHLLIAATASSALGPPQWSFPPVSPSPPPILVALATPRTILQSDHIRHPALCGLYLCRCTRASDRGTFRRPCRLPMRSLPRTRVDAHGDHQNHNRQRQIDSKIIFLELRAPPTRSSPPAASSFFPLRGTPRRPSRARTGDTLTMAIDRLSSSTRLRRAPNPSSSSLGTPSLMLRLFPSPPRRLALAPSYPFSYSGRHHAAVSHFHALPYLRSNLAAQITSIVTPSTVHSSQ
ncbi:hypothetical protein B0H13DRAFT_2361324 [Mycena leptocephala]|nr:hypothetical protein B0H13DRAFT_2361324 [Mycena leptocephala]